MAVFMYANGMTIHNCKKWCEFYFQDFFHELTINYKERRFDIFVLEEITDLDDKVERFDDNFDLTYFNEFWGRDFNVEILIKKKKD